MRAGETCSGEETDGGMEGERGRSSWHDPRVSSAVLEPASLKIAALGSGTESDCTADTFTATLTGGAML